jgi:hypothetical protein
MWESGGVAPLILKLGATMEMNSQLHAPAALPQYPLDRRLVGPHIRSGRGGEEKKILSPCWESESFSP